MISLSSAVLMRGTSVLLDGADLMVYPGQKLGIVGRNGSGKTSLFACLTGELPLDGGSLSMPADLRISQMRQETVGSGRGARDYVIDGDETYRELERALRKAEQAQDFSALTRIHDRLDAMGAYDIANRAERLLAGLGFSVEEFSRPVGSFSGGWRIRLNLAAALMCPSDLLLLDEPTNHLDMEATLWLEQWLVQYPGTLLVVSHDRGFLDRVIDGVVSLENRKTVQYRGNYSAYEKQRAERMAQQQAMVEKQQRRRAQIEDFVRRFRAKASKARQAQSRLKELNRMEEVELAHADSPFSFSLPLASKVPDILLTVDGADIGYGSPVIKGLKLVLRSSDRIGLLGVNGSGKSTLLKALAGEMAPLAGEMLPARHLKVGYFAQHQVDVLPASQSPAAIMQSRFPDVREQDIRDYLGGFDFRGERVDAPTGRFSGGEKARLALALVAFSGPNLLLMDEPTNHLDLEMRHALTLALQEFEGGIVLVSHDRHLLNHTVDRFLLVENGSCREFPGTLEDYEVLVRRGHAGAAAQNTGSGNPNPEAPSSGSAGKNAPEPFLRSQDKKERRQAAAVRRERLAPLRGRLKSVEKDLEKAQAGLQSINARLADQSLYDDGKKSELTALLQEQGQLQGRVEQLEEQWLELIAELETLEN